MSVNNQATLIANPHDVTRFSVSRPPNQFVKRYITNMYSPTTVAELFM
jgi:hypothetical protein